MNSSTLLSVLRSQVYDSEKNNMLRSILPSIHPVTSEDLVTLLRSYVYDADKVRAVEILRTKIIFDPKDTANILNTLVYDSEKNKMLAVLTTLGTISINDLPQILSTMVYDSEKTKAVRTLMAQPNATNHVDFDVVPLDVDTLLASFKHSSELVKVAQLLGVSDDKIAEYKKKAADEECCEINGVKVHTGHMKPGETITVNGTKVTKSESGGLTIDGTGRISSNSGVSVSNWSW